MINYRPTSRAAFKTADLVGTKLEVLNYIRSAGADGSTCDEAITALGIPHQSASPAFHALARYGLIYCSEHKRLTRSNRAALVWFATKPGQKPVAPPPTISALLKSAVSKAIIARATGEWSEFDSIVNHLQTRGAIQ